MMAWSETKIMIRFWIIAAVLAGIGYTLFQNSIGADGPGGRDSSGRGHRRRRSYSDVAGTDPRPPLPDGPFLIVGLARSGVAAAEALLAAGARVYGTDSRNSCGCRQACRASASNSISMATESDCSSA